MYKSYMSEYEAKEHSFDIGSEHIILTGGLTAIVGGFLSCCFEETLKDNIFYSILFAVAVAFLCYWALYLAKYIRHQRHEKISNVKAEKLQREVRQWTQKITSRSFITNEKEAYSILISELAYAYAALFHVDAWHYYNENEAYKRYKKTAPKDSALYKRVYCYLRCAAAEIADDPSTNIVEQRLRSYVDNEANGVEDSEFKNVPRQIFFDEDKQESRRIICGKRVASAAANFICHRLSPVVSDEKYLDEVAQSIFCCLSACLDSPHFSYWRGME